MLDKVQKAQDELILSKLDKADIYGQLAEEASELSQAALKIQRHLNGRNIPNCSLEDAEENLVEEISDICLLFELMGIGPDLNVMDYKRRRWCDRLDKIEKEKEMF